MFAQTFYKFFFSSKSLDTKWQKIVGAISSLDSNQEAPKRQKGQKHVAQNMGGGAQMACKLPDRGRKMV